MPDVPIKEQSPDYSYRIVNPQNPNNPFQRKVKLSTALKAKIESDLDKLYTDWETGTNPLRSKIQRWVNTTEGISEEVNFPWVGASNLCKPITETRINIVHSFFMSVVRPRIGRLFQCTTGKKWDPEKVRRCRYLEAFFNNERDFNLMYVRQLSEAFWAMLRDGTIGRWAIWDKRVERRWEAKIYKSVDEFLKVYQDPGSAGMTPEEFQGYLQDLATNKPVTIDEDYDEVVADGIDLNYTVLKDLVWFPVTVINQKSTEFVGYRFEMTPSDVRSRAKIDEVFDNVEWVSKDEAQNISDSVRQLEQNVEGISEPDKKTMITLVHGRYMKDLDGDGIDEKYLITFAPIKKKLIQMDRYPFFHGNDFLRFSGFKKRPKRLLYRGMAEMIEDLQTEANIAARQRINSRAITNSPMFKAPDVLKDILNPNRPENKFRPGGIWWMPAALLDKVTQVAVDKKDFGDSMAEEANIERAADNVVGASELRSGRETPSDPRAPAAKTAMLLNQSSVRLDDFLYDFVLSENEMLDDVKKLYYQHAPDDLKVYIEEVSSAEGGPAGGPPQNQGAMPLGAPPLPGMLPPGPGASITPPPISGLPSSTMGMPPRVSGPGKPQNLTKEDLNDPDVHLQLAFTSVIENPEYLRNMWEEFYMKYGPEPMLGGIPETRYKILDNIIINMPEALGKNLLPPFPVLQQMMSMQPPPIAAGGGGTPAKPSAPPINPTLLAATTHKGGGSTL